MGTKSILQAVQAMAEASSLEDQHAFWKLKLVETKFEFKPQATFSLEYWSQRLELAEIQFRLADLKLAIECQEHDDKNGWLKTEMGAKLHEQFRSRELNVTLIKKHMERLERADPNRRVFMKLFTTSQMGLKITSTGAGRRDSSMQSHFKTDLIREYNVVDPLDGDQQWCPIIGKYVCSEYMTAAHLFPYFHGQDTMTQIFGEEANEELFSPRNGMFMLTAAEQRFDAGLFVIIPSTSYNCKDITLEGVALWHQKEIQDYEIRIIDKNAPAMTKKISVSSDCRRWNELDGEKLVFKSSFRPRARYLYFHYLCTMLRRAWNIEKKSHALTDELGFPCWGTPGPYISRKMLLAFIEEVGHQYKGVLDNATTAWEGDGGKDQGQTLLIAMSNQLWKCSQRFLCFEGESDDEEE